jgi:malate dehydrogenase
MLKAIDNDTRQTMAVSAYLNGEYGLDGICIGVPCVIGKAGIEKVIEIELSKEEKEAFLRSARAIKSSTDLL